MRSGAILFGCAHVQRDVYKQKNADSIWCAIVAAGLVGLAWTHKLSQIMRPKGEWRIEHLAQVIPVIYNCIHPELLRWKRGSKLCNLFEMSLIEVVVQLYLQSGETICVLLCFNEE